MGHWTDHTFKFDNAVDNMTSNQSELRNLCTLFSHSRFQVLHREGRRNGSCVSNSIGIVRAEVTIKALRMAV